VSRELLVLLFAAFVLLSLLRRSSDAVRQARRRSEERVDTQAAPMPPPLLAPAPSAHQGGPVPDGQSLLVAQIARQEPVARAVGPATAVRTPLPGAERRGSGAHPDGRISLHRAVLLMAILGPCRANHSYDGPESAGGQRAL